MSSGLIHVADEQYGVLRKSARLNPTSIPVQLLTPRLMNYIIISETPIKNNMNYKVIYDSIEPLTLFPTFSNRDGQNRCFDPSLLIDIHTGQTPVCPGVFSNMIVDDSDAQNDVLNALQEMQDTTFESDYDDSTYVDSDDSTYDSDVSDSDVGGDIIMSSNSSDDSSCEDSSSDYDWNDAINSLPSDDSDYENDSLSFNKNLLKQTLLNLQHRMDSMTYGTYLADIEWSVSMEDLNTIAASISANYY
jgi:hypothetical protein